MLALYEIFEMFQFDKYGYNFVTYSQVFRFRSLISGDLTNSIIVMFYRIMFIKLYFKIISNNT